MIEVLEGRQLLASQFLSASMYPVDFGPEAIAAADFNGDGRIDLATANDDASDVSVLLGTRDGFRDAVNYPVGTAPNDILAGDLDGDGRIDLLTVNNSDNSVSVLLGRGDGTFWAPIQSDAGVGPARASIGDFNRDGRADLALANFGGDEPDTGEVLVLLGRGDGTFREPVAYEAHVRPIAVKSVDLNRDGLADLAVVNDGSGDVSLLLGRADSTFEAPVHYRVGLNPDGIAAGDFNGDGKPDLAVTSTQDDDVSVLLGRGDGTLGEATSYPVGLSPRYIVSADFDRDGRADLASANRLSSDVSVLLGRGDGTFDLGVDYATGKAANGIVAADLDGDGRLDLATANADVGQVGVLLGRGDGSFRGSRNDRSGEGRLLGPVDVAAADLNGDGRADLATAHFRTGEVNVLLGDGRGTFRAGPHYETDGLAAFGIAAGDLDADGRPDLVVAQSDLDELNVLLGSGGGTFSDPMAVTVGAESTGVVIGDLDGDGVPDLAVAVRGGVVADVEVDGAAVVLRGNGDGTFQEPIAYPTTDEAEGIIAADLDGDGDLDLVLVIFQTDEINVLLNNGDGSFREADAYDVATSPVDVVAADFDGDGRLDLATANLDDDSVTVLTGGSDGTFQGRRDFDVGQRPFDVAAADFSGDGRIDLAVANSRGDDVSLLYGRGDGTFGGQARFVVGSTPTGLAVLDLNKDGAPDLAVANVNGSNVTILTNTPPSPLGMTIRLTEGRASGPIAVARFQDPDPDASADKYVASISWGDGVTTAGIISSGNDGGFHVLGDHLYAREGTFPFAVSIRNAAGVVLATAGAAQVADAPILASAAALSATEGSPMIGVTVGMFDDLGGPQPLGGYRALIHWGDGTPPQLGTVVADASGFRVLGSHTYESSGAYAIGLTILGAGGSTANAEGSALVADVPITLTGGLSSSTDTGPSASDGITSNNRPIFEGTSEPGSTVRIFVRRVDQFSSMAIGHAVTDDRGRWSLSADSLADGTYAVTATATDRSGRTNASAALVTLVIDTGGLRVTNVVITPRSGQIRITFQHDGSGVADEILLAAAHYSLIRRSGRLTRPIPVTGVLPAATISPSERAVIVVLDGGRRLRRGQYVLSLASASLTNRAGSPLDGEFFTRLPSGNGQVGGSFSARFRFNGRRVSHLGA